MRHLYLDCFSGISGDMCLAALIDAGADPEWLTGELRKLPFYGWEMRATRENSHGVTGIRVKIDVDEGRQPHRHYAGIREMILRSTLPESARNTAAGIFRRIAVAEGKVHGVPADHVHFHEVGAVDSIIDIVGVSLALYFLKVEKVISSPVPTGYGYVKCRHGIMPVPAPAAAELLKGIPLRHLEVQGELTTPTGAAVVAELSEAFGSLPEMTVDTVGYGLGGRDFGMPNFLRVFLGSKFESSVFSECIENVLVMETCIDDSTPEVLGHTMERLLSSGALDVYFTPAQMKKSRPGCLLTVIGRLEDEDHLAGIIFSETTTLGIRSRQERRIALKRTLDEVDTPFGPVRVKTAWDSGGHPLNRAPEYEDCRRRALEKGVSLSKVYEAALLAAVR